jgi:hypothetical protein
MHIRKALIIAYPWIDYILQGTKLWEMRSSSTSHRGWFGLIRKGSGAVQGVARLVDVGSPLSPADMIDSFERHRIPVNRILSGELLKWNTPWKLADVRRLDVPVPYRHKSGAVTWVSLDESVSEAIERQHRGLSLVNGGAQSHEVVALRARVSPGSAIPGTRHRVPTSRSDTPQSVPNDGLWIGDVEINAANIRNNHFYLRRLIHKFPDDVIGGSNKSKSAKKNVLIDWGGPTDAQSDIDGDDKKFFRARGWVGAFFKLHQAEPGDKVVIRETVSYRYSVRLEKRV